VKTINFALSWDKDKCLFTDILQSDLKRKGFSFRWITIDNVQDIIRKLECNELRINVLLDTEATYDEQGDLYARLAYAVKDSGGVVINDPDRTRMSVDKSVMYYELVHAGVTTPYTVVVRNWEPNSFKLTEEEKQKLGVPFIIKPGCGWGHRGVLYDAKGTIREIARARDFDRGDNFLLQEKICPVDLNGKRAWFRIFHVFDKIIPCWWDDRTSRYEHVNETEFARYDLSKLVKMTVKIASLSRMSWFSTEIAIDKVDGRKRFVSIDHVNDQCDMEASSESKDGVPDRIVRLTASSMVDAMKIIVSDKKTPPKRYATCLKGAKEVRKVRGLGYAPDLLLQR